MKNILIILLSFICSAAFAKADLQALYKKGNDEYAKGSYQAALTFYRTVETEGFRSAELYYNIGNCYYQLDSLASSILYYERAKLLDPSDEDIGFNLDIANQKTVDRVDKMPVLFIMDGWQKLASKLSLQGWSFLTITCFWISMIALALYVISAERIKKILFFSIASILFIGGIVTYTIASSQNNRLNKEKEGIIFSPTVTIKSAPSSGKDLFVLHEGTKVRILDKAEGWVKIRLGNGNVGWLPESGIQGI